MKKATANTLPFDGQVSAKKKPFKCPSCCSMLCVLFEDYWKCVNGHQTPHSEEERSRLLGVTMAKTADYNRARWRALDAEPRQTARAERDVTDRFE